MPRVLKNVALLRIVVLGQLALLARRHIGALTPQERRRLLKLARRPHNLSARERKELRSLAAKLEPGAFARNAARTVSPIGGRRGKRG
jgi:branched-subunit amino acid aminotransferase/4-amino-4-deoxychorismate lyase